MAIEDELRERLRKVEALLFGATTAGEREAANAAAERLKAKLAEASRLDPPVEMKFTMWDVLQGRLMTTRNRKYAPILLPATRQSRRGWRQKRPEP